jgi:hypothetical protein
MNQHLPSSLDAKIQAAERQISKRQLAIEQGAVGLVQKIQLKLTSTSSLLMAVGVGFVVGKLFQGQKATSFGKDGKAIRTESPLIVALNLITTARGLYSVLPVDWAMKLVADRKKRRLEPDNKTLQH